MDKIVQLTGARVALGAERAERIDLRIRRGRILPFESKDTPIREYDFSGYLLLPGLINAHDHLDFSLYPRLGRGPWRNAREWAEEVHRPETSPVRELRAVPRGVRLIWGAIRNLLSGVTTVAHHDPMDAVLGRRGFPVRVVRRLAWAHSLDFSPDIVERHRSKPRRWPFVVHAAEGIDERAAAEVDRLEKLGLIDDRTLLVHATGATPDQLDSVRKRGAGIIWCPSTNLFMFGRTRSFPNASLGTDSPLTAEGDLIDEIRVAGLSPRESYDLVITNPTRALRLPPAPVADLIAVPDTGGTPGEAVMNLRPHLVMRAGRALLVSEEFPSDREVPGGTSGMHGLEVEKRGRYRIRAPIPRLFDQARRVLGSEIHLGRKRVVPV